MLFARAGRALSRVLCALSRVRRAPLPVPGAIWFLRPLVLARNRGWESLLVRPNLENKPKSSFIITQCLGGDQCVFKCTRHSCMRERSVERSTDRIRMDGLLPGLKTWAHGAERPFSCTFLIIDKKEFRHIFLFLVMKIFCCA